MLFRIKPIYTGKNFCYSMGKDKKEAQNSEVICLKTGLVLEGGAMRGMFTAGVLDVLMEQGIEVDGIIGVSAGAAFGCNYKSCQKGRAIRYNMRYCDDKRYSGIGCLIKTGNLFGAEFCYGEIPEKLDIFDTETFRSSPMEFYVVATDVETGEPVYHRCPKGDQEDMDWIRASASMPGVSRPVELCGKKLLDGGIVDPIPLKFFEELGYDRIIVVLTQPRDFIKPKTKALPAMKWLLRDYPAVYKAMEQRHHVYNRETAYVRTRENQQKILVIRPEENLPIQRVEHDPNRLKAVYQIGKQVATAEMDQIRRFLQNK